MNSLDQFNSCDAEAFEQWLRTQLNKLYRGSDQERYRAFDLRDLGISRDESHLDALLALYRKLSDDAKGQFQTSLERVLRNANQDEFAGEAMADIVKLIGLTRFRRAFPAFVSILGCGPWGENRPSLIYDALSVLMMFEGSDDVYETTKELATSSNFPDSLVFDALLVLARSRPEKWREDYVLLRKRFENVRNKVAAASDKKLSEQFDSRWRNLCHSLSKLPLSDLGPGLAALADPATLPVDAPAVEPLLTFIAYDKYAPLSTTWHKEADQMVIVDRSHPERMEIFQATAAIVVRTIRGVGGILGQGPRFASLFDGSPTSISTGVRSRLSNILGPRSKPVPDESVQNHA